MKRILAASIATIIMACATTMKPITEASFKKIPHRWNNYTFADFSRGRDLYLTNCGGCHQLHLPAEFTEEQWSTILSTMIERAKLGDAEQELIFRYLLTEKR